MNEEEKRAYHKAYYEAHKEDAKRKAKELYYADHEKNKERRRKYHAKNKDMLNAKSNAYYYAHKEERAQKVKAYRVAHRSKIKEHRLKRDYGISLQEYNSMFASQNGLCAICGESGSLVVDHDHATGKARKLLCGNCNVALGLAKENTTTLTRMIEYLLARD